MIGSEFQFLYFLESKYCREIFSHIFFEIYMKSCITYSSFAKLVLPDIVLFIQAQISKKSHFGKKQIRDTCTSWKVRPCCVLGMYYISIHVYNVFVLFNVKVTILNPLQKFKGAKSCFFWSKCIAAPEELSRCDKNSKNFILHSRQQL